MARKNRSTWRVLGTGLPLLAGVWAAAALLRVEGLRASPYVYFDAEVLIGAATAVLEGNSPYGAYFVSPVTAALYLVPFAALGDGLSYAAWFWFQAASWAAACWLLAQQAARGRSPALVTSIALIFGLYVPVLWSLKGQTTALVALGMAAYCALYPQHPLRAGTALALTAVKLHLAAFPIALLAIAALRSRSPQALIAFGAITFCLFAISFVLRPDWLLEWLAVASNPPAEALGWALHTANFRGLVDPWVPSPLNAILSWAVAAGTAIAATLLALRLALPGPYHRSRQALRIRVRHCEDHAGPAGHSSANKRATCHAEGAGGGRVGGGRTEASRRGARGPLSCEADGFGGLTTGLVAVHGSPDPLPLLALGVSGLFLVAPHAQSYDLSLLVIPLAFVLRCQLARAGHARPYLWPGMAFVYLYPAVTDPLGLPPQTRFLAPLIAFAMVLACLNLPNYSGSRIRSRNWSSHPEERRVWWRGSRPTRCFLRQHDSPDTTVKDTGPVDP